MTANWAKENGCIWTQTSALSFLAASAVCRYAYFCLGTFLSAERGGI